jgi:hypothetical protein
MLIGRNGTLHVVICWTHTGEHIEQADCVGACIIGRVK